MKNSAQRDAYNQDITIQLLKLAYYREGAFNSVESAQAYLREVKELLPKARGLKDPKLNSHIEAVEKKISTGITFSAIPQAIQFETYRNIPDDIFKEVAGMIDVGILAPKIFQDARVTIHSNTIVEVNQKLDGVRSAARNARSSLKLEGRNAQSSRIVDQIEYQLMATAHEVVSLSKDVVNLAIANKDNPKYKQYAAKVFEGVNKAAPYAEAPTLIYYIENGVLNPDVVLNIEHRLRDGMGLGVYNQVLKVAAAKGFSKDVLEKEFARVLHGISKTDYSVIIELAAKQNGGVVPNVKAGDGTEVAPLEFYLQNSIHGQAARVVQSLILHGASTDGMAQYVKEGKGLSCNQDAEKIIGMIAVDQALKSVFSQLKVTVSQMANDPTLKVLPAEAMSNILISVIDSRSQAIMSDNKVLQDINRQAKTPEQKQFMQDFQQALTVGLVGKFCAWVASVFGGEEAKNESIAQTIKEQVSEVLKNNMKPAAEFISNLARAQSQERADGGRGM